MVALELGALCLAAVAGGAWLVGRLLLPAGLCRGRVEEVALGGLLGLVVIGQLDFLLRLGGWRLAPAALALLVAAALAAAMARSVRRRPPVTARAGDARAQPPGQPAPLSQPARPTRLGPLARLALLLLAGGAPLLLLALYPPIDPDPGSYHLPFARGFLESPGLPFFASLRFPVFPQLSELLFAIGLRLHGTTGAHLVEAAMALFTGLLLWVWGRDVGGELAGLVAAALWLGNPMVIFLGSTAHVDVGLAGCVLAGLYCLERARTGPRAAWAVLAGAFLGAAAAVKYLGLFFLAAGAAAIAWRRRFAPRFALAALVVALPVYGHILRVTGNPAFPFFPQVFGYTEWTHDLALRPAQVQPIPVPWTGATVAALLRFPAQRAAALLRGGTRTLDQLARADRDPPHIRAFRRMPDWGRAAVLLALGATWVRGLWRPQLRLAVGVALSSLALWLATLEDMQRLDPRYILAAGPPLALATGAAIAELAGALGRRLRLLGPPRWLRSPSWLARLPSLRAAALTVTALAAVAPGLVYTGIRCRYLGPLPFDAAARAEVQRAHLPGFAALAEAGLRHGRDSVVYGLDLASLTYYAPGRYLGEWFGPARYAKLDFASGEALFSELRRLGADHFLAARDHLATLPRDPTFAAHFRVEHEDEGAVLWELQPAPAAADVPAGPERQARALRPAS
jgi:4-amino-4-deoxy-L-arabinose transferase-like glycosyltransferase